MREVQNLGAGHFSYSEEQILRVDLLLLWGIG